MCPQTKKPGDRDGTRYHENTGLQSNGDHERVSGHRRADRHDRGCVERPESHNATGITAPSGITATITGGTTTALTANVQVGSGVSLGDHTLTLVTPGGNVDFTFNVTLAPHSLSIQEAYTSPEKSP